MREFAPGAVVRWRLRPDLQSTLRQYFRYAEGDATAGMYPRRHAIRFATYAAGATVVATARRRRALPFLAAALGILRMSPAYRRAWRRLEPDEAILALLALPALELAIDCAKMAGYVSGLRRRKTN